MKLGVNWTALILIKASPSRRYSGIIHCRS
jgi:hypothetical protein